LDLRQWFCARHGYLFFNKIGGTVTQRRLRKQSDPPQDLRQMPAVIAMVHFLTGAGSVHSAKRRFGARTDRRG
jgi:hypothetical protein